MFHTKLIVTKSSRLGLAAAMLFVVGGGFSPVEAQDDHAGHDQHRGDGEGTTPGAGQSLADQFQRLHAKVAELEAALKLRHQGRASRSANGDAKSGDMRGAGMGMDGMGMMGGGMMGGGQGMGGMGGGQGGMGMGEMGMGGMGMMGGGTGMGMSQGRGGGAMEGMDMGMMGMGAMGRARGMAGMTMGSALPGFPGASHLYHVGSTGFFLDHAEHIAPTDAQKKELNRIKEQSLLGGATAERKIEEAEQALWALTAADEPDVEGIADRVKEIEAIRADQRLAFIRAVGEAAKVLTDDQRQALAGAAIPNP